MFVYNSTYYFIQFFLISHFNKPPGNERLDKSLMIVAPYKLFVVI